MIIWSFNTYIFSFLRCNFIFFKPFKLFGITFKIYLDRSIQKLALKMRILYFNWYKESWALFRNYFNARAFLLPDNYTKSWKKLTVSFFSIIQLPRLHLNEVWMCRWSPLVWVIFQVVFCFFFLQNIDEHKSYQGKYHLKPIVGHWIKIEILRKAAVQSQMILVTFVKTHSGCWCSCCWL